MAISVDCACANGYRVLYAFRGGSDGAHPSAGLIEDSSGNFYGTTAEGGNGRARCGCGTIFEITAHGAETVLYSFGSTRKDGQFPIAPLMQDKSGNLYGTTEGGGSGCGGICGTVFKLAADGTETVLHSFGIAKNDGIYPYAGVVADHDGNIYGTTGYGGNVENCALGCGTVFKLTPHGKESVLHAFTGGSDGVAPEAGLIADKTGHFFGTTAAGGGTGCNGVGCGTIFRLAADGSEAVLYAFRGGSDGAEPKASLIADAAGNHYGTTAAGGGSGCNGRGCGTVFRLAPDGTETVLYAFTGASDGSDPEGALAADESGNFYGTTSQGGADGIGAVFRLAPDGTDSVLHAFSGEGDGANPLAGLTKDGGNKLHLYGTTEYGGGAAACYEGCGVVFELRK